MAILYAPTVNANEPFPTCIEREPTKWQATQFIAIGHVVINIPQNSAKPKNRIPLIRRIQRQRPSAHNKPIFSVRRLELKSFFLRQCSPRHFLIRVECFQFNCTIFRYISDQQINFFKLNSRLAKQNATLFLLPATVTKQLLHRNCQNTQMSLKALAVRWRCARTKHSHLIEFCISHFSGTERCVPLLHLHGEIAGGAFVSALLKIVLLRVHIALVERTTAPMSTLSSTVACKRIGELSMVRRSCNSSGIVAANLRQHQVDRRLAK